MTGDIVVGVVFMLLSATTMGVLYMKARNHRKKRIIRKSYSIETINGCLAIRCMTCGNVSYNPHDIENKYCGACHRFHSLMASMPKG